MQGLWFKFGQHVPEQLIALLGQGMEFMSKGMAWQISTATFAFQALHPVEFEADITDLENWLAKKRYTIELTEAEREKRAETGCWVRQSPLQIPYFVVRGNSLEECTQRLRRTQPGLPYDWAQLGLGTRLVRADEEKLFLGV